MTAGGFNLNIGFGWTAAQASLNQFAAYARQTFQQVNQAAQQVNPQVNTQAAQQQINNLVNTANQLRNVRINLALEGHQTTVTQLRQISTLANTISSQRAAIQLSIGRGNFEQEIARARQFLQSLNQGDTATLNLKMNNAQLREGLRQLQADIRQVEQRGVNLTVNATGGQGSILESVIGGAGRGLVAGSGVGGSLLIGAGALTGATAAALGTAVAIEKVTSATIAAGKAGIEYNAVLEIQTNTFRHYTGSAESALAVMNQIREASVRAGVDEARGLAAGGAFLRGSPGDIERARELAELTITLSAARPELGFERVQQAMQQLVSGDFVAFEDTMNIAIGSVRQLAAAGVTGMDLYRQAVNRAGGSLELVNANASSFTVRLAALQSNAQAINAAFGRGAFEAASEALGEMSSTATESREAFIALGDFLGSTFVDALIKTTLGANATAESVRNIVQAAAGLGNLLRGLGFGNPPTGSPADQQAGVRTQGSPQQIRENRQAQEQLNGQIAQQQQLVERIERQHGAIKNQIQQITAEYEVQLVPLRAQLELLQTPNFGLQRNLLEAQLRSANADMALTRAQGDPIQLAQLQGQQAALDAQREILSIQHEREDLARNLAAAEERVAQNAIEAQLRAAEAALGRLRREQAAQQDVREVALERLREEVRGHQEARDAALERLREEARLAQEARDVQLETLREVTRTQQENRDRQIEAYRESIQAERDLHDQQMEEMREEQREFEEGYQEARRQEDLAHRASQDRYRERIEALREADQAEQESYRGKTQAELALQALERQRTERERQIELRNATQAILEARTGADLRRARQRLLDVREEQSFEVQREQLRDQIEREEEAREQKSLGRRREIQELERQARSEDRAYQAERARDEDRYQRERADSAREIREIERAEKETRREEDRILREMEREDRELTRQENERIRALEKEDRELTRQENAAIRAEEQADRELTRQENERVREAEREHRQKTREEQEVVRNEEERIAQIRLDNAERTARIQDEADRAHLEQLRESYGIDNQRLGVRQQIAELKDIPALQAATAEASIAKYLEMSAAHLVKVDEITRQIQALGIQEQIAALDAQMNVRLISWRIAEIQASAALRDAETRLNTLKQELADLRRQFTELTAPPVVQGPGLGHHPDDPKMTFPAQTTQQTFWQGAFNLGQQILNGLGAGLVEAATGTDPVSKWAAESIAALLALWQTDSPSRVTIQLGKDIVDGLVEGLSQNNRAAVAALEAPFIEFQDVYMQAFIERMATLGQGAAVSFANGYMSVQVINSISQEMNSIVNFLGQFYESFEVTGHNLAMGIQNGWTQAMSEWTPYVPQATGWSGMGGHQQSSYVDYGGSGSYSDDYDDRGTLPGAEDIANYLYDLGWYREDEGFEDAFDDLARQIYDEGRDPPRDMVVTGRAVGGMMNPGQAYVVHRNELIVPSTPTAVLNDSIVQGIAAMGRTDRQSRASSGPISVSVTNQINGSNLDLEAVAEAVTHRTIPVIVNVLEAAQDQAPRPISKYLGGAD